MSKPELDERVRAVRRFSRFYTRKIGVLHEGLLGSPLSLTEGRVLYELSQREPVTASDIAGELALDAGYLSRILGSFDQRGLIEKPHVGQGWAADHPHPRRPGSRDVRGDQRPFPR